MVQTYEGYFSEDGHFIPYGIRVKMPSKRRAIVNVFINEETGESVSQDSELQSRIERIRLILKAASESENDVMTDDDWNEILSLRSQTNAGLSRTVEV